MQQEDNVLAIDLGKTSCRLRMSHGDRVYEHEVAGAPGLASGDGLRVARAAIKTAVSVLPPAVLAAITRVGIGAAGVNADQENARRLAKGISRELGAPVVVISDGLAAHLGALSGAPGTVLIAGTGAVAFGIHADGRLTRADGWGTWLGDDGSGRWIGQQGIKSALRYHDGRGPATSLSAAAAALAGNFDCLPAFFSTGTSPGRKLASFAPVVLQHAEAGDAVAIAIVEDAVRLLTETALAAVVPGLDLSVLGGLTRNSLLMDLLQHSLLESRLSIVPPWQDALAGAALLARQTDLPHERYAIRV